jgi:putative nucleotidyltransferase with HDIG domain
VSDPLEALSGVPEGVWLVGGALRDRLLGRQTADYDLAVAGDPATVARALGRDAGGYAFELSGAFAVWRVVAHDRTWQVDVLPVNGPSIEADLVARDLTVNAIAQPLAGGDYLDPSGGLGDLRARRLRMVSPRAFASDPLRTLRLVRLAAELDFGVEPETVTAARALAPALEAVAPERIFGELRRILGSPRALAGFDLMATTGVTAAVLPELEALRGVQQSRFHHLDVYDHTRVVLQQTIELELDPERLFPGHGQAIASLLAEPLANELTRAGALRFGALFHDIAKPQTRAVTDQGRVTFMGHDQAGAELARTSLRRLRASERLAEQVAALTRHHLRLGFLVHDMPLSRRAVYGYLRACAPVQVDVTLLSVADRLATRGDGAERAIAKHLELARQLVAEALSWEADPPRPPVRGDQLTKALGIRSGPLVGQVLAALEEASFAGEIAGSEDAIERARQLLNDGG